MADIFELLAMWIPITAGLFMIMTILVAIVYAIGSMLLNEKMKTWAKMELVEIIYSALIIILVVSFIPVVDGVVQGAMGVSNLGTHGITETCMKDSEAGIYDEQTVDICGSDMDGNPIYGDLYSCHIRLATYYLRTIFSEGKIFAYTVYRSYMWSAMLSELSINVETLFEQTGFFTWTPWRGFFTMGNVIKDLTFNWALKIMQLAKFQELMIRFIATALFPSLLIAGAILRTFVFTRKLGGLLLALAVTLYWIFPAFYAFGGLVVLQLKEEAQPMWDAHPANKAHSCDPPVINSLYANGTIRMVGGDVTYDELQDELDRIERMDDEEYADFVQSEGFTPGIDLTNKEAMDEIEGLTEEEKQERYDTYADGFNSWFTTVSKQNMFDKLVGAIGADPVYWGNNGFLEILARLTFFSLFFALFGVIGTIAAIRSISVTFGGDMEIAGLTRLI